MTDAIGRPGLEHCTCSFGVMPACIVLGQQVLMSTRCADSRPPLTMRAPPISRAEDFVSHGDRRRRPRPRELPCPMRAGAAKPGTHILGVAWPRGGGPGACRFYCRPLFAKSGVGIQAPQSPKEGPPKWGYDAMDLVSAMRGGARARQAGALDRHRPDGVAGWGQ